VAAAAWRSHVAWQQRSGVAALGGGASSKRQYRNAYAAETKKKENATIEA